jgi:hypothetical protein
VRRVIELAAVSKLVAFTHEGVIGTNLEEDSTTLRFQFGAAAFDKAWKPGPRARPNGSGLKNGVECTSNQTHRAILKPLVTKFWQPQSMKTISESSTFKLKGAHHLFKLFLR